MTFAELLFAAHTKCGECLVVNVPHNIECGRFFVVREILYLHAEFLFGAANFFLLTSGIFGGPPNFGDGQNVFISLQNSC
jgi:hypothetical protein